MNDLALPSENYLPHGGFYNFSVPVVIPGFGTLAGGIVGTYHYKP